MVLLLWVLVGLTVGVWWLRGGWVLPTLMTLVVSVVLGAGRGFIIEPLWFMCVIGVIWLPTMIWALVGQQRLAGVTK